VPNVADSQYATNKYSCVLTIYTHVTLILLFREYNGEDAPQNRRVVCDFEIKYFAVTVNDKGISPTNPGFGGGIKKRILSRDIET